MTQEIITITVEAGQMTARRKSRKIAQRRPVPVWAIVKYAALTIAGIMLFREGAARALAYRGYFAVGGEVFALFLPVFYYCLSRTVRDLITDITGIGHHLSSTALQGRGNQPESHRKNHRSFRRGGL